MTLTPEDLVDRADGVKAVSHREMVARALMQPARDAERLDEGLAEVRRELAAANASLDAMVAKREAKSMTISPGRGGKQK